MNLEPKQKYLVHKNSRATRPFSGKDEVLDTSDMFETVLSVLCSEPWRWDLFGSSEIRFRQDGTGELICRAELNVWIAAEVEWKPRHAESLNQEFNPNQHDSALVHQIEIELTLTKRRIPDLGGVDMFGYRINEDVLEEEAFMPKTYIICLEKGSFHAQSHQPQEEQPLVEQTGKFELRLTFNPSPYPPRQEWKQPDRAPDAMMFWEWTQFCCRQIDSI
ncbi:hypothetical protein QQS21_005682 [Conoideocrella luteorostrata]|uniref:Uncharacterized protein n=1 Tax=Conoideocrella luteorostrata TaxID=1105319 RepID=A0AAJ0FTL9_9HYPO|nr:hypothetical protein QQS21_005682 [Conoideocrella luteorostrata]